MFSQPSLNTPLALRTQEGRVYHVDRHILMHHSGLFATMLSLPQPTASMGEVIDIWDDDATFQSLLALMCGSPPDAALYLSSFSAFTSLLHLAEKWDCEGIISVLRRSLKHTPFLHFHSLQCFAMARAFLWEGEARLAARLSLAVDLQLPENVSMLGVLSPRDATYLLDLRRERCERFRKLLDSPQRFPMGNGTSYFCDTCNCFRPQDPTWENLKRTLVAALQARPCGVTVMAFIAGEEGWVEGDACWRARCYSCDTLRFDKNVTLALVKACLEVLPDS